jgi:hypothetical protein
MPDQRRACRMCYRVMLDGFEPGMFYDSRHAVLGTVLVLIFVFSMSLVLLNVVGEFYLFILTF